MIMIALLFGCSGKEDAAKKQRNLEAASWPIYRGDAGLSGVSKSEIPGKPALLWTFQTGGEILSSPVIGSGRVYIGSTDGKICAINLRDGGKVWEFDTGDDIEAPPLLVNGIVYIGNLSGDFFALHAQTGQVLWKAHTEGPIHGSANRISVPESGEDLILIGSHDNKMYCFAAGKGKLKWAYETEHFINGAPAADAEHIVFGGCDEKLHILSVRDGSKTGEVPVGSYIPGSAALVGHRAYVGHYGSKLVCIDVRDKKILWEYQDKEHADSFFSSPAVGKDYVVIGSRDGYVHCVNRETGKKAWDFRTRDDVDSSPVIAGSKVIAASSDGRLYVLGLKDGKKTWSYEIGAAIIGCPAVAGGLIVTGAEDGRIYTFGEGS